MHDRGSVPTGHPAFEVCHIAGMKPFACSYRKGGKRYAITLYGTSSDQVLNDNCVELSDLTIDGELCSSIPSDDEEAWRIIDAYEAGQEKQK